MPVYTKGSVDEATDAFVIPCVSRLQFSLLPVVKQEAASHLEEPEGAIQ